MNQSLLTASEPRTVRTVAVIGAGRYGRAFALRCVQAGFAVILEDVLSSNLRQAEAEVLGELPSARQHLQLAGSVEDAVRTADLAVDFVPDELESKLEIFSMMDRMAPPHTVFCTPTLLSITDLASCTYREERCIGVKPFDVAEASTAHLVRGAATSDSTVLSAQEMFQLLGFSVILSHAPAFTSASF